MANQLLEQPAASSLDSAVRCPILIIEDDAAIAEPLAHRLDQHGFRPIWAATGHEGLRLARLQLPRLVLLDLRLPDIDGFSLCQALDDDRATCAIPKIVLSGMERPDIIRAARSAGCLFYLRKPYDPNALLILIEQALLESEL